MEIDFNQVLKQMDDVTDLVDDDKKSLTLRVVCVNALLAPPMDHNERVSGMEKQKRSDLARKIYHAKGKLKLDAEQVSMVKRLVGDAYHTIVVGQAYRMLEDENAKPDHPND